MILQYGLFLLFFTPLVEVVELIVFVEKRTTNLLIQTMVFTDTKHKTVLTFKSLNRFRISLIKFIIEREPVKIKTRLIKY